MNTFISVFEEACTLLGCSNELPDVTGKSEKKAKRIIADHILETLLAANNMKANDGKPWEANLADTTEKKWYPFFEIIQDKDAPAGFRLAFVGYFFVNDYAGIGARHACKTKELAAFMGKNCADIYKDTLS